MIHKEGRVFLVVLLVILVVLYVILDTLVASELVKQLYLIVGGGVFIFCLQFFRNPKIEVIQNPKQVLAPADGKVVVIEETKEEEFLNENRIQISIFMSPINKHNNRNPVSGTIKYLKYHAGKYLVAWHPKSSTENERTTIVYEMADGLQILIRQIAGAMARRIRFYIHENDLVSQGEEFGFIKFGSRVDVFLPLDAKVMVSVDQKTEGGKTVLAELT